MSENMRKGVLQTQSNQTAQQGSHVMIDKTAVCAAAFKAPGHSLVLGGQCPC